MLLVLVAARCFMGYYNLSIRQYVVDFTAIPAEDDLCQIPLDVTVQFALMAEVPLAYSHIRFRRGPVQVRMTMQAYQPQEYRIVALFGVYSETLEPLYVVYPKKLVYIAAAIGTAVLLLGIAFGVVCGCAVYKRRKVERISSYVDEWIGRSLVNNEQRASVVATDENVTRQCWAPGHMVDMY